MLRRTLPRALGLATAVMLGLGSAWYWRSLRAADARLGALTSDPRFDARRQQAGAPKEGSLALVAELARRGMHRLDDTTLVRNAAVMARVLGAVRVGQCSRLARSPRLDEVLDDPKALTAIDSATTREWIDLTFLAARRELEEHPLHELTDDQATAAMSALLASIPAEQRPRLVHALSAPSEASAADACWAARTLYGGVARIAEPQRSWLARAALPDA